MHAPSATGHPLHEPVLGWYSVHARDLPWRSRTVSPWGVLVSEVMLQQTPVTRVLPVWGEWVRRWPAPRDLAASAPGDAVRAWGRLGYPRRALRLHEAATVLVRRHGGLVPDDVAALRALPGVGDYTAAAVATFAFGRRHAVVDTNVRRVHARAVTGTAQPAPALTARETLLARSLLPDDEGTAARWAVAVMELGALVCTARSPRCASCPVADLCAWRLAGAPAHDGPTRRAQRWEGTDRQARGALLAVLRASPGPVPADELTAAWHDGPQRDRCLASLVEDGLAEPSADGGAYRLPAGAATP